MFGSPHAKLALEFDEAKKVARADLHHQCTIWNAIDLEGGFSLSTSSN